MVAQQRSNQNWQDRSNTNNPKAASNVDKYMLKCTHCNKIATSRVVALNGRIIIMSSEIKTLRKPQLQLLLKVKYKIILLRRPPH